MNYTPIANTINPKFELMRSCFVEKYSHKIMVVSDVETKVDYTTGYRVTKLRLEQVDFSYPNYIKHIPTPPSIEVLLEGVHIRYETEPNRNGRVYIIELYHIGNCSTIEQCYYEYPELFL